MINPRIAIIGGGIAGLTAAWRLQAGGLEALVFEAENLPGGRARSFSENRMVHDLGAWTFAAQSPTHRLARELNLKNQIINIPTTIGRPVRTKLKVGNLRQPSSLLGSVYKTRQVFDLLRLLRMAETVPTKTPDETAFRWASKHFPQSFVQDVLEPIAGLYFLQELHTLSRDYLLRTIRYLSRIKLHSFKSGMGQLALQLARRIQLRSRAKVENLEIDNNGILIQGSHFSESTLGVIIATPLPAAISLLSRYLAPHVLKVAMQWKYAAILMTHFLLKSKLPKVALQVLPPFGNRNLACGLTIERVKHAARIPQGMETVTMYARPDQMATLDKKSDDDVRTIFLSELHHWLAIPKKNIEKCWITRWRHGAAFCDPKVPERIAVLNAGLAELRKTAPIWLAGDFFGTSGLDGAVTSAEKAATDCLHYFNKSIP
jgi:oxygen-dependent protoporphyrinogen oxidase